MKAGEATHYRVVLRPWEIAHVATVGAQRTVANLNRANAPHYRDASRREDERTASHAAAAAECATARLLNQYWTAGGAWVAARHGEFADLADVGENIEVRRVRDHGTTTFAVRERDMGRTIVACFVVPPELTEVRVLGWIQGPDAWEVGQPVEDYTRVPIEALTRGPLPPDIPTRPEAEEFVFTGRRS